MGGVVKSASKVFGGVMELFTGPKAPKVPDTPDAPTIDEAEQSRIESRRLMRRRGRGSTILSNPAARAPGVGVNKLLGGSA